MMVVFAVLLVGQVSVMLLHWDLTYSFALGLLVCILLIFDFGVVVGVKLESLSFLLDLSDGDEDLDSVLDRLLDCKCGG